jgi:hypothetical protein
MADDKQEQKQVTPKGLEIPVPKRKDVMDALRKLRSARQEALSLNPPFF